ncbi:sulfotransferase family protein [Nonomuraea sp. NEAU-A123]|uniref:sulfotransferase family protein n=1 Tax=Nonomuraea sp. NEAU-A123 TaxID=2839649 RepID=UPI001BE3F629|nr:sulfotransferase family protein [Nonomuraea sp. NEAU-A123]MBT2228851.1 hypothetical protein [Nonomuraea sp. NEAU-A123]
MINVIGAGLPRTGTTSLKAALERLGFGPCHHMTVRDPHAWYASLRDTVFALLHNPGAVPPEFHPVVTGMRPLLEHIWRDTFGTTLDDAMPEERHAVEVFQRHTAEVTDALPADRVLIYQSGQDWQPLCDFLGVPVPDQPYPRLNDRQSAQTRLRGVADR